MPEIQKYSLVEKLHEADSKLQGSPSLLGMTMLTYPNYINAMRSTMFTSHLKQFLNLLYPEVPHVFTNNENLVGKYSSGYKKAPDELKVVKKIVKYDDILEIDNPKVYLLFVFNTKKEKYDVIKRIDCEDLTENFGYQINNEIIDSFDEGDIINKDTVLSKSTSYDDDMNYSYGRNAITIYTLDPFTSEDAAIVSESFSKKMTTIETETIRIGLNNNDFLLNLYGTKKKYQPLPKIGQVISDKAAVLRRQFNNQLLFDFKDSSLREIHDGDLIYYVDDNVEILDYTIYNNNEEEIDNPFYDQINELIREQNKYYKEILDTCEMIINSGYKYSREIDYLYKRSKEMLDNKKKWKEGDTAFSNMEIEVKVKRYVPLTKGFKISGRYGNKSVDAKIVPDDDMPYTKDGRKVELMINLLAIINRTTSFVLYELFITGSAYQVRQKMKTLPTLQEKENMLFDFISILNEDQSSKMYKEYKKLKKKEKELYIQDAIDNGIYIHQSPMWEKMPIFYRCQNLLIKFPFIKEDDLYIKKWGREKKVLTKYFVGEMYTIKLKQSDKRGFSARSTGALDSKSLPTRSFKSKSHLERNSSSCIRFGEFESLNFSIGLIPEDIALFHALYRTSIKGRRDLVSVMFGDEDAIQKIDSSYTSRVAEIFNVRLKSLGIGLDFVDEENEVKILNNDIISDHKIEDKVYMCTDYQAFIMERINDIKNELLEKHVILPEDNLKKMIEDIMRTRKYISGPLIDEIENLDEMIEEDLQREYERYKKQVIQDMTENRYTDETTIEEITE